MTTTSIHQAYQEGLQGLTHERLARAARHMQTVLDNGALLIPFFDQTWRMAPGGIRDLQGRPPTEAVGLVLCRYVAQYPAAAVAAGAKVTFRELTAAGPLAANFAHNTNKLIASGFTGRLENLRTQCRQMDGRIESRADGPDLSVCFMALPRVPLYLEFNADDDLFPAQAALLFHQSAEHYLDIRTLFILGTYLAGRLVAWHPQHRP